MFMCVWCVWVRMVLGCVGVCVWWCGCVGVCVCGGERGVVWWMWVSVVGLGCVGGGVCG